jgi:hypothetical protein
MLLPFTVFGDGNKDIKRIIEIAIPDWEQLIGSAAGFSIIYAWLLLVLGLAGNAYFVAWDREGNKS